MLGRLLEAGKEAGRHFGVKLSNTLAAANMRGVLPGSEMYMSGRALYPLTMSLAAKLAADFSGDLPMSFSGGISAWNLAEVLETGIRPVTLATDLLKPGGYGRLKELAEIAAAHSASWNTARVDVEKAKRAARAGLEARVFQKEFRGAAPVRVEGPLPLFDCFVAPCVRACPISQDVPEYVHLAGAGKHEQALAHILERNPLPFITGYLCDHQCMENCSRKDWEGAVRIREVKRIAAEGGYGPLMSGGGIAGQRVEPRGVKAAVVGAGPAGLAAGAFLAREGFEVHIFDREKEPGGVVRYLLPGFRLPADAVEKDVSFLRDLGVVLHFDQRKIPPVGELKSSGFTYIVAAIGAEDERDIGIPGACSALDFLRRFRTVPGGLRLGTSVAVIGAGDTAMDAARAAKRCPGVERVRIVYRRTGQEMPASEEEYRAAVQDGIEFHFLRAPERWENGGRLVCRVMELGAVDEGGRRRPVPTEKQETLAADAVISAVGMDVDSKALESLGLGNAASTDPKTQETSIPEVFLIGDAASGASTIVKAIASARRAADAICAREGGSRRRGIAAPPEDLASLRRHRDRLRPAARPGADDGETAKTESLRCLGCGALCLKCVEVCPNRANTIVRVEGFRDEAQIIHLDALCNECGNCATFCPWDGRPYKDKLTVFEREDDFRDSDNPGFFLRGGMAVLRIRGQEREVALDSLEKPPAGTEEQAARAVVHAIVHDHSYLLGVPGL
jgi:putative selenate reductase